MTWLSLLYLLLGLTTVIMTRSWEGSLAFTFVALFAWPWVWIIILIDWVRGY